MANNEKRVRRWSVLARVAHWNNLIMVLLLIYTGAALLIPGGNVLANIVGGFYVTRTVHRVAAVFFVGVPLAIVLSRPRALIKFFREVFTWGRDDLAWFVRFPIYFFRPSYKMPPVHGKSTSGQRVLAWVMLSGAVIQVITGPILWFRPFGKGVVLWSVAFHDLGFLLITFGLVFHVYVGLGIFKPYRGVSWGMLGDGTVPERLARRHWPEWSEQVSRGGEG